MVHVEHVRALRREADALVAAATAAGLSRDVPSCPGWDVERLVGHTARAQRWALATVDRSPAVELVPPEELERPPAGPGVVAWFADGAQRLADTLGQADPEAAAWAWGGDQRVRFWSRRMAHETAVHRWDAQAAASSGRPIEAQLAADGIDELFANLPYVPTRVGLTGAGESMHVHCTDVEGEWLVTLAPDGLRVVREHAKGDVALRGPASEVLLVLMGRIPAAGVEVFGDDALFARWLELATL